MHSHARHVHAVHTHAVHAQAAHVNVMHAHVMHNHAVHCLFYVRINNDRLTVAVRPKPVYQQRANSPTAKFGMSLKINGDMPAVACDTMVTCPLPPKVMTCLCTN
jgi:hypothetical protein